MSTSSGQRERRKGAGSEADKRLLHLASRCSVAHRRLLDGSLMVDDQLRQYLSRLIRDLQEALVYATEGHLITWLIEGPPLEDE